MTKEELLERNKQIALMLGAEINDTLERIYIDKMLDDELIFHNMSVNLSSYEWSGTRNIHYIPFDMLQFNSDWNWLMEALKFIEDELKLKTVISNNCMGICNQYININKGISIIDETVTINSKILGHGTTKKEAIFKAVSEFAEFHNRSI
jgi:hypothetical protein